MAVLGLLGVWLVRSHYGGDLKKLMSDYGYCFFFTALIPLIGRECGVQSSAIMVQGFGQ